MLFSTNARWRQADASIVLLTAEKIIAWLAHLQDWPRWHSRGSSATVFQDTDGTLLVHLKNCLRTPSWTRGYGCLLAGGHESLETHRAHRLKDFLSSGSGKMGARSQPVRSRRDFTTKINVSESALRFWKWVFQIYGRCLRALYGVSKNAQSHCCYQSRRNRPNCPLGISKALSAIQLATTHLRYHVLCWVSVNLLNFPKSPQPYSTGLQYGDPVRYALSPGTISHKDEEYNTNDGTA